MAGYDPLPAQSPIDLEAALPIVHLFPPDHVRLVWSHNEKGKPNEAGPHGREIEFEDSQSHMLLTLPGQQVPTKFTLVKLHFHAPGEHQINRVRSTLELHIVHAAEEPDPHNPGDYRKIYAVLGIMVEPKPDAVAWTPASRRTDLFRKITERFNILEDYKGDEKDKPDLDFDFDPSDLLPFDPASPLTDAAFWRYEGSLTSDRFNPNEGHVSWLVLRETRQIEEPDLGRWVGKLKHKAKLVQPLDRRFVLFHPGATGQSAGTPPAAPSTT